MNATRFPPAELRVLVVDDEPDTAATLALLLTIGGHLVRTAADGEAGLALAEQWPPDVVFLDYALTGGTDGRELALRLRERPGERRPLLVMLTGFGDAGHRERARAAVDLYLVKPAEPNRLLSLLDRFGQLLDYAGRSA